MNSANGRGESHTNLAVRQTVVAGASGATGTYTVPGWTPGSSLKSVVNLTSGADVTSEFSDAGGVVRRGAGNATGNLLILFIAGHPRGGSLRRR